MQIPVSILTDLQEWNIDINAFKEAHEQSVPTSIHVNSKKNTINQIVKDLEPVSWNSNGFYLPTRLHFAQDPLWHAGAYYVQEASSMLIGLVIKQLVKDNDGALVVLDACAAPGGKSTQLLQNLLPNCIVVSNEVIKARVSILQENLVKWGSANSIVTNNDPKDFGLLKHFFDIILIDAPCSGSGLFRKNKEAINEWSDNNVNLCMQRQNRIIHDLWPCLKPNGNLIYATCSYSNKENEDIADTIIDIGAKSVKINIDKELNILETQSKKHNAFGYRCMPHLVKGEGFFVSFFLKDADNELMRYNSKKQSLKLLNKEEKSIANKFILNTDYLYYINDYIHHMPGNMANIFLTLKNFLYIKQAGISIGQIIKHDLLPNHALAMTTDLENTFEKIELDIENALLYLKKLNVVSKIETNGWNQVTYKGVPLGFLKNIGNRINNYYPPNYRLIK